MAEALFFAGNNSHLDAEKDRRGCWKRGYVVIVKPDGHVWGIEESPATATRMANGNLRFSIVKFPGISVARIEKYLAEQLDVVTGGTFRRRLWQLQWAELPQQARNKLAAGTLVIGSQAQGGDYTWAQVRDYFMRLDTNARETEALV